MAKVKEIRSKISEMISKSGVLRGEAGYWGRPKSLVSRKSLPRVSEVIDHSDREYCSSYCLPPAPALNLSINNETDFADFSLV